MSEPRRAAAAAAQMRPVSSAVGYNRDLFVARLAPWDHPRGMDRLPMQGCLWRCAGCASLARYDAAALPQSKNIQAAQTDDFFHEGGEALSQ